MFKFPCEVVIRFLLPSMRKEMALYFLNGKNLKQRDIARILGITDAAVSQYIKGKRGSYFKFDNNAVKKIHTIADALLKHYKKHEKEHNACEIMLKTCQLCRELRSSRALCHLHKELGLDIGSCQACQGV